MKRIIFLLVCLPSFSWAAIALVHHATHGDCVITLSPSVGNIVGICCSSQSGVYTASVSDNASGGSNSYTESVGSRGGFSGSVSVTTSFTSRITNSGATTITCGGNCYSSAAFEYSGGLASGNPVDVSTGNVHVACSGTNCTGASITTNNSGDAIFTCAQPGTNITAIANPYTDFLNDPGNGMGSADHIPGTTVTNEAAVWTSGSGDSIGSSVVAILPAAGGAVPTGINFKITGNGITK